MKKIVLLLNVFILLAISCNVDPGTDPETGSLSISVPMYSSWVTDPSSRAYAIANTARFTLTDSSGTDVIAPWTETSGSGDISSIKQGITPGNGYTLTVEIFNTAVSTTDPVVTGTAAVNISAGAITATTVTCIPNNPAALTLGTPTGSVPLNTNQEIWYQFTVPSEFPYNIKLTSADDLDLALFNSTGLITNTGTNIIGVLDAGDYYIGVSNTDTDSSFDLSVDTVDIISLTVEDSWTDGLLTTDGVVYYTFNAAAGTRYSIGWDDINQGSGSYTTNVTVSVYDNTWSSFFAGRYDGYTTPSIIDCDYTGPVYIKVYGSGTGTFGLKVLSEGLAAPAHVAASDGTVTGEVSLTWDSVATASSYTIYRSDASDGTYSQIGTSAVNSYTDSTATDWKLTYYYKVTAVDAGSAEGAISAYNAGYPRIPAPTNINATDGDYVESVVITWDAVADSSTYRVFRGMNSDLTGNTNYHSSKGLYYVWDTSMTGYYYSVAAYDPVHGIYSEYGTPDQGSVGNTGTDGALDVSVH